MTEQIRYAILQKRTPPIRVFSYPVANPRSDYNEPQYIVVDKKDIQVRGNKEDICGTVNEIDMLGFRSWLCGHSSTPGILF
jgi:hypothetical protein